MNRNFLVTGAAGFIGSHTVEALLKRGDSVVGLDNLNDYYNPGRKRSNLDDVRCSAGTTGRFIFIEGDIRDRKLLGRLFGENHFDAVVHLAAMAGVRASVADPHLYFDVNLTGTVNLLDAARDHKIANFVFASTSSAYGNTPRIPFVETDACDRPLAPYPASKRAGEMIGFTYHHLFGLSFTALRFFTVYGPRGRPDMMPHKVLDNIFFGNEVPLYNNGQMYRDWTFVSDIVSGVVAAADRPLGYEIINLGRGEPVLLAEFIHTLEQITGKTARLVPSPMMDGDVVSTHADVTKARGLLGYDPRVSVQEGAMRFCQWYQRAVLDQK